MADAKSKVSLFKMLGPGLLVAATGVGAGDLATAAFTGAELGTVVLWAVVLGAFLKYVLNEGLARWQLATGQTLLEGCIANYGRWFQWVFLLYLLIWSFLVGLALVSACGATLHALVPIYDASTDKVIYGIAQSLIALILVELGGFKLFEKLMTVCIGAMFVIVVATAVALQPAPSEVVSGLLLPKIPGFFAEGPESGLSWTVALLGGVGGTLTILCYGYWIKEEGRNGTEDLRGCRIDLASGYLMTALFGVMMVIIGSRSGPFSGTGSKLLVELSETLNQTLGPTAAMLFLIGAWGAVFSSLLGVWQSVPYLFADFWRMRVGRTETVETKSASYRGFLYGLAIVPCLGLASIPFQSVQKIYAITGALVIPFLAAILLHLTGTSRFLEKPFRNRWCTNLVLVLILIFFFGIALQQVLVALDA